MFYTWNDWKDGEAPLLGAVYGGYLQWYGAGNGGGIDPAARLARTVFWGGRIGLFASAKWPRATKACEAWWRNSSRCSEHPSLSDLWADGAAPRLEEHRTQASAPGGHGRSRTGLHRSGRAQAWRSPDGQVGVCLFNTLDRPVDAEFDLTAIGGMVALPTPASSSAAGHAGSASVCQFAGRLSISLPSMVRVLVEVGTSAAAKR